jgi:hypothetical protein
MLLRARMAPLIRRSGANFECRHCKSIQQYAFVVIARMHIHSDGYLPCIRTAALNC